MFPRWSTIVAVRVVLQALINNMYKHGKGDLGDKTFLEILFEK